MPSQRYWMQETSSHLSWETGARQNLDSASTTATQNKPLKVAGLG